MNLLAIFLVILHVLQGRALIREFFDKFQETKNKYLELSEITAEIINQNANESRSNYVAVIGVINDHHLTDNVLRKISTTFASPSEVHGLARDTIIFMQNYNETFLEENLDHIHRRGKVVICVARLYWEDVEFLEEYTAVASSLWANRFSRMIFIAWIRDELNIFGIRPYDERTCFPTELIKIAKVNGGRILKQRPFYEKIKNLNECLLRVTTTTGMPYAETFVENNLTRVKGIEGNILHILSKRMNFTTLITDTAKLVGFDSRFNDSKDRLRSNESDLCFAGKKVNIHGIEPTVSIMDCQKIWIVPKAQMIPPWMQVIIPFEKSVWITLVVTLFFVGLIFLLLDGRISFLIDIWSLFLGVSIEVRRIPLKKLVKMLLAVWIFFSYIITRSYLASLEGHLTKPTFLSEIDTLEELVASGIPIEGHPIVGKLFCRNNQTAVDRNICSRFRKRSIEAIFKEIKMKGELGSAFTMKADIFKNSKFLRDYETHAMQEVLLKYPTAFLAQTGAPFLDEMNVVITRLVEAGFVDLWKRENFLIHDKKKHYPEKLKVEHILGILFVTTLGWATSITVFCIECSTSHINFARFKNTIQWPK